MTETIPVLRAAFRSDPGRIRTNNEDLPLVDRERGVFGVIDGVGGHAAGELAAAIARDVILQRLSRPLGTPAERVREAIAIANNEIFRRASESPELRGMTCVITLALLTGSTMTIGHVGDSRLYKLDGRGIRKLTRDHSPVGEREDAQELSEHEAMRHPRRHEVFRDVGSARRDKDEEEYVDITETSIEADSAFLLCTDGLSDMLSSAAIDRIVRQHAGNPGAVVRALVDAANDAGGKDNVTVVYFEAPEFARAVRGRVTSGPAPGSGLPESQPARHGNRVLGAARGIVRSRATWFFVGALAGVLAALLLVWRVPAATAAFGSRTLVVAPGLQGAFARIGDALNEARSGDTVRVEPGLYPERVVVRDGVSLQARIPSSVTLARAAGDPGEWVAIQAFGDMGAEISGIRIESTAELPIDVGIRVTGQRTLKLIEMAGPMRTGVELLAAGTLTLHGSYFAVNGAALTAGERSQSSMTRNVFLKAGRARGSPIAVAPLAQATLRDNVFAGYPGEIVAGATAATKQQIVADNVIVSMTERRP